MCNFIKLLYAEWFGKHNPKLDGSNLFSTEYSVSAQYTSVVKLFQREDTKAFVRIPVQGNTIQQFLKASRLAYSNGIEVIALLDSYENDASMMNRLNSIKTLASYVKYIEIFNELPWMNDCYPGEKIQSLKELLDKTNKYSDWIHNNIPDGKAITEATYNLMDERDNGWNVTNTEITKQLILYTVADICAIHLYGNSFGKKLQLVELSNNIKDWNNEASKKGYAKKIFVTECGTEPWNNQVKYYNKIIKLIRNTIDPDAIIWYRQAIKKVDDIDNGFALEIIDNLQISPLYQKLTS